MLWAQKRRKKEEKEGWVESMQSYVGDGRVCMSKNRFEEGAKLINAPQCLNEPNEWKKLCVCI